MRMVSNGDNDDDYNVDGSSNGDDYGDERVGEAGTDKVLIWERWFDVEDEWETIAMVLFRHHLGWFWQTDWSKWKASRNRPGVFTTRSQKESSSIGIIKICLPWLQKNS